MDELIGLLHDWGVVVAALLLLGLASRGLLRVIVMAWPKGHARRAELVAELREVPYERRLLFVLAQLETALVEGLPVRWRAGRRGKRAVADVVAAPAGVPRWRRVTPACESNWRRLPRRTRLGRLHAVDHAWDALEQEVQEAALAAGVAGLWWRSSLRRLERAVAADGDRWAPLFAGVRELHRVQRRFSDVYTYQSGKVHFVTTANIPTAKAAIDFRAAAESLREDLRRLAASFDGSPGLG